MLKWKLYFLNTRGRKYIFVVTEATDQKFDITFNIHGLAKKAFKCFALVSILCSISIFFALYCYICILIFRRIMFNTEITKSAGTPDIGFVVCS